MLLIILNNIIITIIDDYLGLSRGNENRMKAHVTDLEGLYSEIIEAKKFDPELSMLYDKAAEYARLHLRARKTSGCNGLGEMDNLLDEFREMNYKIIRYCRRKKYIDDLAIYTIDMSDKELEKVGAELGEFL